MPTTNEDFFTRERMQAIGLGIGRGFQSYDPNNPFAGAGAAMEATIGAQMGFEARDRSRQERIDDLAAVEKKQIEAEKRAKEMQIDSERRAEAAKIRSEERQRENARKDQQEMLDRFKNMRVGVVDPGRAKKSREFSQFSEWFANLFGGNAPRFKGKSPISLFDESMAMEPSPDKERPSPMRRPPGVELMRGDEDWGSTPSNPSGARNTYIDSKGMKRYTDTGQPFGTF